MPAGLTAIQAFRLLGLWLAIAVASQHVVHHAWDEMSRWDCCIL